MKYLILLAMAISLFTATNAQKTKTSPVQKTGKSFIVSAVTAKDLPEGVTFVNDKITLKSGFKFESLPNNGGVKLVNAKGVISGTFECACAGATKCSITILGSLLTCDGGNCCRFITTIKSSNMSDMQMKQN